MAPNEPPNPDAANRLVANLQAGFDVEDSFRQLFQAYGSSVERFFLVRRCPPQEAGDLTQDTFVNAFQGIHTYRHQSSLKTQ